MADAVNPSPARRGYRSALRTRQAGETRRRIVEAAATLFGEQGYAGTSLAQIARVAGVSTESVAAGGPKRALLIAAFESALGGREGSDLVSERAEMQTLLSTAELPVLLETIGEMVVTGAARSNGLWRALAAAAAEDLAVAALYDDLSRRRRADARVAIDVLAARGLLRRDVPLPRLADTVALLNGMDSYQLFVEEFGWTAQELKQWWTDAIRRLVLAP